MLWKDLWAWKATNLSPVYSATNATCWYLNLDLFTKQLLYYREETTTSPQHWSNSLLFKFQAHYSHQDVPSATSNWTACRASSTLSSTCLPGAALSATGSCRNTMDRLRRDTLFLLYRGRGLIKKHRLLSLVFEAKQRNLCILVCTVPVARLQWSSS